MILDRKERFGVFYNFFVGVSASPRKIAPTGWKVPSKSDWETLITVVGSASSGRKLKYPWIWNYNPDTRGYYDYYFNALPGGWRNGSGVFDSIKYTGYWWTNTSELSIYGWYFKMNASDTGQTISYITKESGFTLRLLKENDTPPTDNQITDYEGNVYKTIKIGNQVWTTENWKCTKFDDGTQIDIVEDPDEWKIDYGGNLTPACCYYDNDKLNYF